MEELYRQIEEYQPVNEQEEVDKGVMLKYIKQFDDVLTRDNELFHFTTSAWIVNEDRTKVLMIYHNIYNSWGWVGGHADGIADLKEVLKREIEEETGVTEYKLLNENIFGLSVQIVNGHVKRGKYVSSHLHFDLQYLFEVKDDIELKIKPDENSNVGWINVDDVLDCVTEEHMKPIYIKLMNKVNKQSEE